MKRLNTKFIYHHADNYTLIMTAGGEGTCSVCIDDHVKSCALIYNLSVEEKYRRKGYGKSLLNEAEKEACKLGASSVSLSAKIDTFMFDWYKRYGYDSVLSYDGYITLYKKVNQ